MTIFLTQWRRYRYTRAPQEDLASGARDGYTHMYNRVTVGFTNIKRVIEDTLLYAKNLEEAL